MNLWTRRRNPPEITAEQLYQVMETLKPDLLERLGGRLYLLPVIDAELTRWRATRAPEPALAIPARALRAGAMTYADAAQWVDDAMADLARLRPPGPDEDGVGFSRATDGPGRRWLAHANSTGGAETLTPALLLAGVEILRAHSHTQLNRDDWEAAHDAVAAVAPMPAKEAKKLLRVRPGSTSAQGDTESDGAYRWDAKGLKLKTSYKSSFSLKGTVIERAGFTKNVDFAWRNLGYNNFVLWIAPHAVERFGEWISDAYPTYAAVIQANAAEWLQDAEDAGIQTTEAPKAPKAREAVDLGNLNPESGSAEGVRWEWSAKDNRRLLVLFPNFDIAKAVGNLAHAQNAYRGSYPKEYWRAYDSQDAPLKIASVLESGRFGLNSAAEAFKQLAPAWGHAPKVSKAEQDASEKRARMLVRRFRHMVDPGMRDTDASKRAIIESIPMLDRIQAGDDNADLGAWGSWAVVKTHAREEIQVFTPYAMNGWENRVTGVKRRSGLLKGWGAVGDVRRAPAIARALDDINAPLAMSIRLGLLTEQLGGDERDCATLEELASAQTVIEIIDPAVRAKVEAINRKIPWPEGLNPYPYQRVGIGFAVMSGGRALIGDSMGLGKTIQAIGFMLHNVATTTPTLVIAPTVYNWRNELIKWGGGLLRPVIVENSRTRLPQARPGDVFVVSWGLVALVYERLLAQGFRTIIMDESQYAKNAKSNRSEAVRALALNAEHRLLLSGTAMENRPNKLELWHQLHMIDPYTFPDKKDFGTKFASLTKRTVGGRTFYDDRGASNLDELRDTLRCFMVRRLKSEVATELPDKTREAMWIQLDPKAQRAYDAIEGDMEAAICAAWRERSVKQARKMVADGATAREAVIAVNQAQPDAGALSQLVIVQLGYLRRAVAEAKTPAAIQWILDFVQGDTPLLVFYEHKVVLESIAPALNKAKVSWDYIDGSINQKKREQKVSDLNEGRIQVLVGSKAMHAGWNLQGASDALFVERWWVPSQEEQAEDRMYRIGQKNAVTVRYLMANGTVDVQVAELVDAKRNLIESVMRGEDVTKRRQELTPQAKETERASLSEALRNRVLARLMGACKVSIDDIM
tara:strand:+ start:5665 stop:8928 length:3264 start_codon:yes stop_codon:yes gene_type:complete